MRSLLLLCWLACAAVLTDRLHAAPSYSITNLGSIGGNSSVAYSINNAGVVAGTATNADGSSLAFVHNGTELKVLGAGSGRAINNSGSVAGYSDDRGQPTASVWDGSGVELPSTFGGSQSYGLAINDFGHLAGSSASGGGDAQATLSSGGIERSLGTLGGRWSSAYGINNSGQVAGTATNGRGDFRGFRWTANGGMENLGTLGGNGSWASDINEAGTVVGTSLTNKGVFHAFAFLQSGMEDLGSFGGSSFAYSINQSSEIVGYSEDKDGASRAYVYTGGVMFDLNALVGNLDGWWLQAAYGINDLGQIVGTGFHNGQSTSFRLDLKNSTGAGEGELSPGGVSTVPEPGTNALIGLGVLSGFFWRRKTLG
jgi:probable HAF family extracellular repeat protein